MTFLHFRYREKLGLLASAALSPTETDGLMGHVASCETCREELAQLTLTATVLRADAALDRPLPISSDALRTRVFARIRSEASERPGRAPSWSFLPAMNALGLVGIGLLAGVLIARLPEGPAPVIEDEASAALPQLVATAETAVNDAAFYERLEKTHLRANAARYLAEAQDVLIQVTAAADCPDSPKDSVDVQREAQTSRTLLKRRAALVSSGSETLLAAQGVMEEVEGVLQQVADLPQCTRRQDVDAIARKMDRKKLLMKIDMVSQELATP